MPNLEHLAILKQGVKAWNEWRENWPDVTPDLSGADLSRADLRGANFGFSRLIDVNLSLAKLSDAHLNEADLTGAKLVGAKLSYANLIGAKLVGAKLSYANLIGANLSAADLSFADLLGADLTRTNLSAATMLGTTIANVDLSDAIGLDAVVHYGPSSVGIDTIYKSRGKIPETFLRGAGVPESFITYMSSLVGDAFGFYSCFISYSGKDQAFAEQLHADLQKNGVRCWFAPENLKIGDKTRPTIGGSIREYDKLLLILSEHSIASDWVEYEVETALAREQEQKRTVLFPVRLDDAIMDIKTGWPAHIKNTRHIGDFLHWKDHDAYQESFAGLLKDLRAEETRRR